MQVTQQDAPHKDKVCETLLCPGSNSGSNIKFRECTLVHVILATLVKSYSLSLQGCSLLIALEGTFREFIPPKYPAVQQEVWHGFRKVAEINNSKLFYFEIPHVVFGVWSFLKSCLQEGEILLQNITAYTSNQPVLWVHNTNLLCHVRGIVISTKMEIF
jgi:hypothetical protein